MIAATIVLLLFVLLAAGTPVGFALSVCGAVGLLWVGGLNVLLGALASTPHDTAAVFEA